MKHKLFHKDDFLSSLSLLFVSLPLSAGIAVASKAPPEAGVITAIFGAIFFGLFSSSPLAVFGPAAGLSIFLSSAALSFGEFSSVSSSILVAGVFLMVLSFSPVVKLVSMFPRSVIKGMVAGIGIMLILKMIPHLLGYDAISLGTEQFSQSDGRNTITEIIWGFENFLPGALFISLLSLALITLTSQLKKRGYLTRRLSFAVFVVALGVIINLIFERYFPHLHLTGSHLLEIGSTRIRFQPLTGFGSDWELILETSLIIMAVIVLEGLITLDIFRKVDPRHTPVKLKKEMFLLGIANVVMGLVGALPVMPVLVRSTANVEFGAKSKMSVIYHGFWLIIALSFDRIFGFIPMASVAAVLFVVGFNLIDFKEMKKMINMGLDHYIPYFMTMSFIFFFDLLWGVIAGFTMGVVFALRASSMRSMVMVNDDERFLLKFHKDVTFLNKAELKEHLDSVPSDKEILIDGTGNIFVDKEIEEWLEDFMEECQERGCKLTFMKSRLAISYLFKESHG